MADMTKSTLMQELEAAEPFYLFAGPNVCQSEEFVMKMARQCKAVVEKVNKDKGCNIKYVFKTSFDKANRTNAASYRGPGMDEGLKIMQKVKDTFGLPIITDVHEGGQCAKVAEVADVIQIPAFLCRQTDLLVAAGKTGKIINIKKGQFCASSVMRNSAEKIRYAGNPNVLVCERGSMYGYTDLVVDMRNIVTMRDSNAPTCADVTHSLQQPAGKAVGSGGVASGGLRDLIPTIARSCVASGVNGLFMEIHDDPNTSPVDGPTQWPLKHFYELLCELVDIANATKARKRWGGTGTDETIDLTPCGEDIPGL